MVCAAMPKFFTKVQNYSLIHIFYCNYINICTNLFLLKIWIFVQSPTLSRDNIIRTNYYSVYHLTKKIARRSIVQAGRKRQIFTVVISYLGFVEIGGK